MEKKQVFTNGMPSIENLSKNEIKIFCETLLASAIELYRNDDK